MKIVVGLIDLLWLAGLFVLVDFYFMVFVSCAKSVIELWILFLKFARDECYVPFFNLLDQNVYSMTISVCFSLENFIIV